MLPCAICPSRAKTIASSRPNVDAIGVGGDARIVRDHQHGAAPLVGHLAQQPGDFVRGARVEIARRLVG